MLINKIRPQVHAIAALPMVIGSLSVVQPCHAQPEAAPKVREPALREELLQREKQDAAIRAEYQAFREKNGLLGPDEQEKKAKNPELAKGAYDIAVRMGKIDEANHQRMKEVVVKYGWPGKSLVGADGAGAAWLFVQHADSDVPFQRQCLDLIVKLPRGEVAPEHLAYLTDRVLLNEGKKQMYGTMLRKENGKLVPKSLEDEENVDKRRAELGLPPLAEYIKKMSPSILPKKE
jgi:hypothetical protein